MESMYLSCCQLIWKEIWLEQYLCLFNNHCIYSRGSFKARFFWGVRLFELGLVNQNEGQIDLVTSQN